MIEKGTEKSICGKHRYSGANRTKEIFLVNGKMFTEAFKRDASQCCVDCVSEYNKRAKAKVA